MDADTRKNIAARDAALAKTGRLTRRAAAVAATGVLVLMAGFAHLIPTHLPHLSGDGTGSGAGPGGSRTGDPGGTGTGNGGPAPGTGSGPSQVTSGGS